MDRWQDSLENEDLRTNPVLDRYKTLEDALASIPEAKSTLGRSIVLPPSDATQEMMQKFDQKLMEKVPGLVRMPEVDDEEDFARFMHSLGVPEEKDKYTKPEGVEMPDEMIADLTEIAFATGMTQNQYEKYLVTYATANSERVQAAQEAREQAEEELKKLWGAAHDDNIKITDTIAEKFAGKDMPLENLNNAQRIALLNIANSVSSDPQVFTQVSTPSTKRTPAEITARIDDIRQLLLDKKVFGDKRSKLLREQNKLYDELDAY